MQSKRLVALAVTTVLLFGGAACGGDDAAESSEAPTETYTIVSDATVTQGLAATQQLLANIESGAEADKTKALDKVFADWYAYEGTVKKNEVNLYLDFEDALAVFQKAIKANSATDAKAASAKFATAAQTYLAKHPG